MPAAVGGWVPWLLPHARFPPQAWWPWLGLLPVAAGATLYAWCAAEFARSLGTPLPGADTATLVVRGPYRLVRNPMYLAVLCAVLGWGVLLRSFWLLGYAAGFLVVVTIFVVLVEEPRLARRFGTEYGAYCAQVGRWLPAIPVKATPWPLEASRK